MVSIHYQSFLVGRDLFRGYSPIRTCLRKASSLINVGLFCLFISSGSAYAQSNSSVTTTSGYKAVQPGDSEFDNTSDPFTLYWQEANEEYQDTVFGELVYNEPSTPTKLEMLRLLSKETPSLVVFMHAVSMGLSVDEMLFAGLEYKPEATRSLAGSAVSILPLLDLDDVYRYPTYGLEGLKRYVDGQLEEENKGYVNRGDEHKPYSVQEVIDKFFQDRLVLAPYPDWFDGQFHFMASAQELSKLQINRNAKNWYHSKSTKTVDDRPIFVSLYEHDKTVLIDGVERINLALKQNREVQLPVVFVYNRANERPVDGLGYPATLRGLRDAYVERNLMVTPTPEWQIGEYHSYVDINEFYHFFDIPQEGDFEPEAWNALLTEARTYEVNNTSFIVVILPSQGPSVEKTAGQHFTDGAKLAAWDNPRTESKFKYTSPNNASGQGLSSLLGKGMVVNRPDLIAALKALGVSRLPTSVYYLDKARVKPYKRGARSLIQAALGADAPVIVPPGGGLFAPPVDLPPASPPGLP